MLLRLAINLDFSSLFYESKRLHKLCGSSALPPGPVRGDLGRVEVVDMEALNEPRFSWLNAISEQVSQISRVRWVLVNLGMCAAVSMSLLTHYYLGAWICDCWLMLAYACA